jgi:sensor histidine kinase YesM
MSNSTRLYWGAQIIGWFSYGLLVFLATYAESPEKIDVSFLINISSLLFFGIGCTHLMRTYYLKTQWLDVRLFPLIPRVLLISFICSVCIGLGTEMAGILSSTKQQPFNLLDWLITVFALLILVIFWNSVYFTFHFFQKSRQQELNNISLEASRNEIELKNLLSQLNPHFLFNSLNSIRALIDIEPKKAKDAVTILSSLLRKSLLIGKEELVPISVEIELVDNYLQLEKIRFEERLTVLWDIDKSLNEVLIPPFCIQTLVENAIKHGISNLVSGGEIIVRTFIEPNTLCIEVRNTGQFSEVRGTGIGIVNTQRRLDLQFKGKAQLKLTQTEKDVIARIEIKN